MPTRTDFNTHIKQENPLSVYVLVGTVNFLVHEAYQKLKNKVVQQAPDFNCDEFRVNDVSVNSIVGCARMMPMMAHQRWVGVEQIDKLKTAEQNILLNYLEKPVPSTVLCMRGTKLDLRTKLGKRLSSLNAIFALDSPRGEALSQWLLTYAREEGIELKRDALKLLIDLMGEELGILRMTIDKIGLYVGEKKMIDSHDIETLVAPTKIESIFSLTDAIGVRDLAQVTRQLRTILDRGENALMILAMIARHMRQLLHLKALTLHRLNTTALAKKIGVQPFLVTRLQNQAGHYKIVELANALAAITRANVQLKTSRTPAGVILDRLLMDLVL